MKGRLLVDWVAKPAVVSMPSLRLNEAGKATFSLERSPDSNAEISSAKITDTDNFTLKRIDDSAEGNPTYEVGFRGRDSVGHQSTQIFIETTGENTPALTIQVQARASLNLSYAKRVRFSRKDGEIQPRVYRLSARNGEAPTIKKVVDRDGLLDITVLEPRGAMASLELTVKPEVFAALDHDAQIGPHTLVIHTDDRDEKKIEIEYQVSPERPISARSAPRPPVEGTVSPTTAPVPPATANPH